MVEGARRDVRSLQEFGSAIGDRAEMDKSIIPSSRVKDDDPYNRARFARCRRWFFRRAETSLARGYLAEPFDGVVAGDLEQPGGAAGVGFPGGGPWVAWAKGRSRD